MNGAFEPIVKNTQRVGYPDTQVMAKPEALCLF